MSQTSGTADCYEDQELVKKELIHNLRLSWWKNSIKLITGHLNLQCEGNDNKLSLTHCVYKQTISFVWIRSICHEPLSDILRNKSAFISLHII